MVARRLVSTCRYTVQTDAACNSGVCFPMGGEREERGGEGTS